MNAIAVLVLLIGIALHVDRARPPSDRSQSLEAAAHHVCADHELTSRDVVLCEDFEDHATLQQWDIGSNGGTWPAADFVRCGFDFGFQSSCAAWSNLLLFDTFWGHWGFDAWHQFEPQSEFYVRWLQQASDSYQWGTLEDKSLILHDPPLASMTAYVAVSRNHLPVERHSGPGMPYVANYQDLDWPETGGQFERINRFQNQGSDIALEPGRWYLFEWYVKMNTPGVSDGVTRLWIDDALSGAPQRTLRLAYDDMRWLRAEDAGKQFGFLRLTAYSQRCDIAPNECPPVGPAILNQSLRWDDIIVSRKRIRRPPYQ